MDVLDLDTPHGPARAHVRAAEGQAGSLVLGHGAGGGVTARDLVAAADVAGDLGFGVALVEQPYRVAGRKSPAPARQLDAAWTSVVEQLRAGPLRGGVPLVTGGRSMGARVACRTAAAVGAAGVICLAFPQQPPRRAGREPAPTRQAELDAVEVPVLVVQGDRDPFGMPAAGPRREIAVIPGDHSLRAGLGELREAVRAWLDAIAA